MGNRYELQKLNMVRTDRGFTLVDLRERREEILRVAARHGASNVRVFGSVARGEADVQSDVDFLVDIETDRRGFEFFSLLEDLRRELEGLLGVPVDVGEAVQDHAQRHVEREAVPLSADLTPTICSTSATVSSAWNVGRHPAVPPY